MHAQNYFWEDTDSYIIEMFLTKIFSKLYSISCICVTKFFHSHPELQQHSEYNKYTIHSYIIGHLFDAYLYCLKVKIGDKVNEKSSQSKKFSLLSDEPYCVY